ncbi:MAG TPA: hypothetical protein VGG97_06945 [Bryobacteraceae bacterium]
MSIELFARFAVGGVLFYGTQKFCKEVEEKLNADTKLAISLWLLSPSISNKVQLWPKGVDGTFTTVFGNKHFSPQSFIHSAIGSYLSATFAYILAQYLWLTPVGVIGIIAPPAQKHYLQVVTLVASFTLCNLIPDYISLLKIRYLLGRMVGGSLWKAAWLLLVDLALTFGLGYLSVFLASVCWLTFTYWNGASFNGNYMAMVQNGIGVAVLTFTFWHHPAMYDELAPLYLFPAFVPSIWLWLYTVSGLIVKWVRRFELGIGRMHLVFDIENKPLQSVGIVAGTAVAIFYWVGLIILVIHGWR